MSMEILGGIGILEVDFSRMFQFVLMFEQFDVSLFRK